MVDSNTQYKEVECHDLRPLLPLYVDGELDQQDQAVIEQHLAQCESCAKNVHFDRSLKAKIKNAIVECDQIALPPSLKSKLRRQASQARAGQQLKRYGIPAACAAAAAVLFTVATSSAFAPLVKESVQRHTDNVRVDYASQDAARIERVLSQRLGHAVEVPKFRNNRISLRGARMVRMNNRPAAYLVYGTPRSKISVIALPDPQHKLEIRDQRLPKPEGRPLHFDHNSGYNVVVWRQQNMVYSMVSDMHHREIIKLFFDDSKKRQPVSNPAVQAVPVSF